MRVISSSTSDLAANRATSARTRSSTPPSRTSRRRSPRRARYAATASGTSGATSARRWRISATRASRASASFAPSRARAAASSSSARRHKSASTVRLRSSSSAASASTPGQRNTSAVRSGATPGNALAASAARLRSCWIAWTLSCCCTATALLKLRRQSTLPRAMRPAISSRSMGSAARSSSATRNCRSRKREFTERSSRCRAPRGDSAVATA